MEFMQSEKVHFTKEKETLLITLYAKALQSRWKNPILKDEWAEEAVDHTDYNFEKLKIGKRRAHLIARRAKQFDLWTTAYLADHVDATVLHLGCGLDSRIYRVNPPASVRWFNIDYPEVIELRKRLYPKRVGYRMIGASLADLVWLDEVPEDNPAIIVAEGVSMYLTEDIMKKLLNRLTDHFPSGQIAFDVHSRRLVDLTARTRTTVGGTGASFGWGIDDPQDIKKLEPRLSLLAEVRASRLVGGSEYHGLDAFLFV